MYPIETNVNMMRGAPIYQNNDMIGANYVPAQSPTYKSHLPNLPREQNIMDANCTSNVVEGTKTTNNYTRVNNNPINTYNAYNNFVNCNVHSNINKCNNIDINNRQDYCENVNNNNNDSYNNYVDTINNTQQSNINVYNNSVANERQIVQFNDNCDIDNACNPPRPNSESSLASSSRLKFTWNPYASRLVENDNNKEVEKSYSMSTFQMSYSDADKANYSTSTCNAPAYWNNNYSNNKNNDNNICIRPNQLNCDDENGLQFQQLFEQQHQQFQQIEPREYQNNYLYVNQNTFDNNNINNMCAINALDQNQDISCYNIYDEHNNNNNSNVNNNYINNFMTMADNIKYGTALQYPNEQMTQAPFINNTYPNVGNELNEMYFQQPYCSHELPKHTHAPMPEATHIFTDNLQPVHMPAFTFAKPSYWQTEESLMHCNSMQNSVDTLQKLESCIADDGHQCYLDFSSSNTSQKRSSNDSVYPLSGQTPEHKTLQSCSVIPSSFTSSPTTAQTTSTTTTTTTTTTTNASDRKESNTDINVQVEVMSTPCLSSDALIETSILAIPVKEDGQTYDVNEYTIFKNNNDDDNNIDDAHIDGQLVVYNDIINIDDNNDDVNMDERTKYDNLHYRNYVDNHNFYKYYQSLEDYINQTENLLKNIITIPQHPLIAQMRVGLYRPLIVDDHTPAVLTVLQTRPSFFITRMLPPPPLTSTLVLTTSNVETICAACRRWLIHVNAAITGQARRIKEDELMKTKTNNATHANNSVYVASTENKVDTNYVYVDDKDANPDHTTTNTNDNNSNNNNTIYDNQNDTSKITEILSDVHNLTEDDKNTCKSELQIIKEEIKSVSPQKSNEKQSQKEDQTEIHIDSNTNTNVAVSEK